jgi:hypothetical protein
MFTRESFRHLNKKKASVVRETAGSSAVDFSVHHLPWIFFSWSPSPSSTQGPFLRQPAVNFPNSPPPSAMARTPGEEGEGRTSSGFRAWLPGRRASWPTVVCLRDISSCSPQWSGRVSMKSTKHTPHHSLTPPNPHHHHSSYFLPPTTSAPAPAPSSSSAVSSPRVAFFTAGTTTYQAPPPCLVGIPSRTGWLHHGQAKPEPAGGMVNSIAGRPPMANLHRLAQKQSGAASCPSAEARLADATTPQIVPTAGRPAPHCFHHATVAGTPLIPTSWLTGKRLPMPDSSGLQRRRSLW